MHSIRFILCSLFLMLMASTAGAADEELRVKIGKELGSVTVMHDGEPVTIKRDQDPDARIADAYAQTSRDCPPFCVQPMQLLPGVQTIGELELLDFLKRKSEGDDSILVIDSRTPDWVARGTIPGSVNIPWTQLYREASTYDPFLVESLLTERFGATVDGAVWDFRDAKTLVLFCNGPWCGQSPTNIKALVSMGYPAHKIYWYRGGMQAWHSLGLTVVKP